MSKKEFILKIKTVEKIASSSKLKRMLAHPIKYFFAILFRELIYKKTKREKEVISNTFFNSKMHLLLPSSTDIFLTGGKSHDSEIRLAKFLINYLENKDTFIDVGAHYGYFSLLASKLVGSLGKVYAFEASPTSYKIFHKNELNFKNIQGYNLVISDKNSYLTFYEFPNLYSEYNTLYINQYKDQDWIDEYAPKEVKVKSILLGNFLIEEGINPKIIKIDVEGAEFKVINGLKTYLLNKSPFIVMEYLSDNRGNEEHKKAEKLLSSLKFHPFIINTEGELEEVESISQSILNRSLESDNIVFVKENTS